MHSLVIPSMPESLHSKLSRMASRRQRTLPQQALEILEGAIDLEETRSLLPTVESSPRWKQRQLLPLYRGLLESGKLTSNRDSTTGLSEDRDAR